MRTQKTSFMKMAIFSVLVLLFAAPTFANLVPNGDFVSGGSGWYSGGRINFGGQRVNLNDDNRSPSGYLYRYINTVVGQEYRIEFDYAAHGNANYYYRMRVRVRVGTAPVVVDQTMTAGPISFGWQTASFTFIAQQTSTRIYFNDASTYTWAVDMHLDNVSVVESNPPVPDAGPDQSFDCVIGSQSVTLDGSGSDDPDGDVLSYSWTGPFGTVTGMNPLVDLECGPHTINMTVSDGYGHSESDEVLVTVNCDTEDPVLDIPDDLVVYANCAGGFEGLIGEASATDDCDPDPTISSDAPEVFPMGDTQVTYTATNATGNFSTAIQIVTVEPFQIVIDIKPGNDNNSVNPRSKGVIPVAVLSDADFDATTLDISSLRFGPGGAGTAHSGHISDVDDDGDDDLMLHFRTQETGVSNDDISLCMTGFTESGIPVAGCDGINGNALQRPIPGNAEGIVPNALSLEQNYPNPFNPSTVIEYGLPEAAGVSLLVYDMRGAVVANLVNDYQQAGLYQIEFDGSSLSSGTYIYVLNANGNQFVKRFSLMK